MAESIPVKYEDLADKLQKKHDKVKAVLGTELVGSCEKIRSHGIKLNGDTRPLPGVNTIDLSHSIREPGFSFDANMAGFVIRHDADKAESSHTRGKEKDEAVPRDRPQDDNKRYLAEEEVRNIWHPRPSPEHLLSKYDQQYDRRRRYDNDDEGYRRSDADGRYRQDNGHDDGYERRARGRSKEQDNMDKHWNCPFFKHCWDSGMSRLPTIEDCPECTQRRRRTNEVSVFKRLGPLPPQSRAESSQEEDFEESDGEEDRRKKEAETRYPEVEKLCLCLVFTCTKLHHILLTAEIFVICKSDVVKHMLSAPVLKGRLGKWMLALSEFDLRYQPAKAVKGQALADLIAERISTNIAALSIRAWAMFFDGSACDDGCGIGILLVSPRGTEYSFSIRLSTPCTNNVAEYEAVRKGMELLLEAGAEAVELFGDSKLVINQLTDEYKCESESLFPYWMECRELMTQFRYINFNWVPRSQNTEANNLAQMASGYIDTPEGSEVQVQFLEQDDWRAEIFKYLKDSARGAPKRIRYKAMKYVLIGDDMFYRTLEGLLLKCLGPTESNRLLHEVHEGACGTHQSAHKMKWLIRRSGFYWPTMLEDCFNYYKGCQACQMFGKIQMVPASAMNPIIKPWPFRGWGMDMIGKIHPASSKKHEWILAITDYFTKWVEAVPMKKVKSEDVIKFVKEHVIHRFGIPQTITTDGGSVFVSKEFRGFCDDMGIKLIRSSPYYAQANGQAEASNQSLIKLIKRKIEENPRDWHEKLSEALWAYRMSCHGAIKTSPYQLVYGQEAVLPWEITAGSRRVTFQDDLTADEYAALMSDTIEDATELRLWSLEKKISSA
ncbi:hypothetical protein QYE76_030149 [Lolium multiflorum]|uniref:Uncharacterized protein n=1 Tax=Lolium multiflorum TaxID=4521 RepID=A0AAD8QQM1_LOLMU|nr:hypothetical protein QYE76_030149 [Lolium multiflorum]